MFSTVRDIIIVIRVHGPSGPVRKIDQSCSFLPTTELAYKIDQHLMSSQHSEKALVEDGGFTQKKKG